MRLAALAALLAAARALAPGALCRPRATAHVGPQPLLRLDARPPPRAHPTHPPRADEQPQLQIGDGALLDRYDPLAAHVLVGSALVVAFLCAPAHATDAVGTTTVVISSSSMLPSSMELAGAAASAAAVPTLQEILANAGRRALGGGISGAIAGVLQVFTLMWLRTTMNYQYRYGTSTGEALRTLYAEGGVGRLYQGLPFALVQTPLSRFGDTAANSGVLALLAAIDSPLPMAARTAIASAAAAGWRIGLTPLDTCKTTLQVTGSRGLDQLKAKVQSEGFTVLFQGALANAAASFVGNYPWYLTFNTLDTMLPIAPQDDLVLRLCRSALLGASAASVSDTVSNGIRVLKTTRQTSPTTISYQEALQQVLERDGWQGLFFRGLQTRLIVNCLQAALFTVIWKFLEEELGKAGFF